MFGSLLVPFLFLFRQLLRAWNQCTVRSAASLAPYNSILLMHGFEVVKQSRNVGCIVTYSLL